LKNCRSRNTGRQTGAALKGNRQRGTLHIPQRSAETGWPPEQLALLGTLPNADLAAPLGRSTTAVRVKRTKLSIASAWDPRRLLIVTIPPMQPSWVSKTRARKRPRKGEAMEYDCQHCGACCIDAFGRNSYVSLSAAEALHFRRKGLPVVSWGCGDYLGTIPHAGPGGESICAAFRGEVGGNCACSVYADRPANCRAFRAGSADCRTARRKAGLPD
jgi:Fe-S-cluster containining protein